MAFSSSKSSTQGTPRQAQKQDYKTLALALGGLLIVGFVVIILLVFLFGGAAGGAPIGQKCVGILTLEGPITTESTPSSLFDMGAPGSEDIAQAIRGVNKRDDVGALLIVVNSPGGSVVASREIYDSVKELKKPKVAYFREVAASGGYYVSAPMDYIISDPNALTGSIGVIATFTELSGLFEKIGINTTTIKSGQFKDIGSPERPMTEDERVLFQNLIQETYQEFYNVVLEGRKGRINREKFDEVADGRVLSGRQAYAVGLVDELGDKRKAIAKAADLASISYEDVDSIPLCTISASEEGSSIFGVFQPLRLPQIKGKKISLSFE